MDEQIEQAIGKYVEAARTGDCELMRKAFLAEATVRGSYGGAPVDWPLQEFCDLIAKGGPAPDLEARIAAVEISGTAAMARLEAVNWRGTRYTDFFLLLRRNDEWRIASKAFFAHDRA
ncbi:MAG: nuclear transport factor 2 family protein [Enhydrobacter sp.]|nr:nuclear transport factor 2 family protein [Enhydrobacter sp.]